MTAVRPVSYAQILDAPNAAELMAEYAAECSVAEYGEACPQRELYAQMERSGAFHAFGVLDGERLCGFATLLIFVLPHYGSKIAAVESLFVAKAWRSGGAGGRLMDALEAYAAQQGAAAIQYVAPVKSRLARFLFLSADRYRNTNHVFVKRLA